MSDPNSPEGEKATFLAGLSAQITLDGQTVHCETLELRSDGAVFEGSFSIAESPKVGVLVQSDAGDLELAVQARITSFKSGTLKVSFNGLNEQQQHVVDSIRSRAMEGMLPSAIGGLERGASIAEIKEALSKVPLSHRVNLARRALHLDRSFLRHDESSQVLEALARNPQLTQQEVVQMLRLPHLLPTTLEVFSLDPRWQASEEVKITIATHPRVSFSVAERLVRTLTIVGIRRVIRRPGLNPAIKQKLVQSIPHKQLQGW